MSTTSTTSTTTKKYKYLKDGTTYEYMKRMQREKYAADENFVAFAKLKYYKKKYNGNEDFNIIINNKEIDNIEKLKEVKIFNINFKNN
tara:strand:+ start:1196 stop:1459 length:264 start_codon:yes stop_codon:yes gene_type:complete